MAFKIDINDIFRYERKVGIVYLSFSKSKCVMEDIIWLKNQIVLIHIISKRSRVTIYIILIRYDPDELNFFCIQLINNDKKMHKIFHV